MTYEEYTTKLAELRKVWLSKESAPSKAKDSKGFAAWDKDVEETLRKPCLELYNQWLKSNA